MKTTITARSKSPILRPDAKKQAAPIQSNINAKSGKPILNKAAFSDQVKLAQLNSYQNQQQAQYQTVDERRQPMHGATTANNNNPKANPTAGAVVKGHKKYPTSSNILEEVNPNKIRREHDLMQVLNSKPTSKVNVGYNVSSGLSSIPIKVNNNIMSNITTHKQGEWEEPEMTSAHIVNVNKGLMTNPQHENMLVGTVREDRKNQNEFYEKLNNNQKVRSRSPKEAYEHIHGENSKMENLIYKSVQRMEEKKSKAFPQQPNSYNEGENFQFETYDREEDEKLVLLKLIEDLEASRRTKEEEIKKAREKLSLKEQEYRQEQESQNMLNEALNNHLDGLRKEVEQTEAQLKSSKETLKEHEKSEKETSAIVERYKKEVEQMTNNLKNLQIQKEKEIKELDRKLREEEIRHEQLKKNLEDATQQLREEEKNMAEFERLQDELAQSKDSLSKWEERKRGLAQNLEEVRQTSSRLHEELKQQINSKKNELEKSKSEFHSKCEKKEEEIRLLEKEIEEIKSHINLEKVKNERYRLSLEESLAKNQAERDKLTQEIAEIEESNNLELENAKGEMQKLEDKSLKSSESAQELEKIKENLLKEINDTKKICEKQLEELEQTNKTLEEENESLQESTNNLIRENEELQNKFAAQAALKEKELLASLNTVNKEIEDFTFLIESLNKAKADLENDVNDLTEKLQKENLKKMDFLNKENEKNTVIKRLKGELEDLRKMNEDNKTLLQKMIEEKSKNETELNDVNNLIDIYQKEMEKNLNTINDMMEKETKQMNRIKELETEIKNKKKK